MAPGNMYNNRDSIDINELAALNEDISDDLIDKLSQQLTQNVTETEKPPVNENDDSTLFEEPKNDSKNTSGAESEKKEQVSINTSFDDNFIKKYKAKLNKKPQAQEEDTSLPLSRSGGGTEEAEDIDIPELMQRSSKSEAQQEEQIEKISQGKITEKPMTKEQKEYNDSLDYLDGNVKYSKYVIYIDPQNVDFIESLSVKERKTLINNILRHQDDIQLTKQKYKMVQTAITHIIIAIITVAVSIPFIYHVINTALEVSIDNYRRSQMNFETLYKEKGKITNRR